MNKISKRPRTTLEQKIMILNHHHKSQNSQAETVNHFKTKYSISTSSFSEWLKDEQNLRSLYNNSNEFLRNSKRKLNFKYDKINKEMDKIVQSALQENQVINEPMLRQHWCKLVSIYGVQDPKRISSFSHGWLTQFKKRNGISKNKKPIELVENDYDLFDSN
ncbi:Tigger transposable element-derived protein 4 [Wickerhamomyces ciferrii]|uniref:Tigger transposable element-derived protein 4 n=1 Tax=Wickerhamomyces ciferrii (strain ATCC 14091 / BCRC 22168 / CBS 111 / JCM 3599 / NBRC 0793 / NRRL Y-1031 F-60-10) TaxID=1206466 RepID=K0KMP8_WICCF|nr:Tigger transposable element-derived protein 4 [Wickerhamomyces ciferrii]CCH43482.1 Tigger transposable element-derived protein 4 [Wickerhamomyces ciferrii]